MGKLEEKFGYQFGAYSKSDQDKIMPNIAIFTKTPMIINGFQIPEVNVLNLIGHGFDTPSQPDWQYFLSEEGVIKSGRETELYERIEMMYRYAFECAKRNNLKRVQFAGIGEGNFAGKMKAKITDFQKRAINALTKEEQYSSQIELVVDS